MSIERVAFPNPGDPVCSVLSCSFYVSDGDDAATPASENIGINWLNATTMAFQNAAIQGVTVCIASSDTGTDSKVGDGKAHAQYPASSPWVLSVGGTTVENVRGALFDQYVRNDTFFGGVSGAMGGGISDFFALPSYQNGAGVPEVAANASPNSGYT